MNTHTCTRTCTRAHTHNLLKVEDVSFTLTQLQHLKQHCLVPSQKFNSLKIYHYHQALCPVTLEMETTLRLQEQGGREVSERVKTKLNGSTLVSYYKLHGQLYTQLGQKVKDFLFKNVLQERFCLCLMNFKDRLCIHPEQLADHARHSQPKLSYVYDAPVDTRVTPPHKNNYRVEFMPTWK